MQVTSDSLLRDPSTHARSRGGGSQLHISHLRVQGLRIRVSGILYEQTFDLKLSGNEVYYTAPSLLVIFFKTCGKLHRQIFFN